MNDGVIEEIICEMLPDYAKKVLLAGTEEYTSLVLIWEEDGRRGTTLINLYDSEGESISAFGITEYDVRRGMKIICQMRDSLVKPMGHPTRVITVEP